MIKICNLKMEQLGTEGKKVCKQVRDLKTGAQALLDNDNTGCM